MGKSSIGETFAHLQTYMCEQKTKLMEEIGRKIQCFF